MGPKLNGKRRSIAIGLPVVIVLLPLAYNLFSFVMARGGQDPRPFLEMPDAQHQACVKETLYMRYHHMDLLLEIREGVIRDGVRSDIGLNDCRDCHRSRERFCNQCHKPANVRLDCFGCHYYPEPPPTENRADAGIQAGPVPRGPSESDGMDG